MAYIVNLTENMITSAIITHLFNKFSNREGYLYGIVSVIPNNIWTNSRIFIKLGINVSTQATLSLYLLTSYNQ
jgi:hypothetical protein